MLLPGSDYKKKRSSELPQDAPQIIRFVLASVLFTSAVFATGGAVHQFQYGRYRVGAICNDGWQSSATGRGACSHHGGVNCWLYSDGTCTNP